MRPARQQVFVEFVQQRTPDLFGVAFALAGRQDRAERLVQTALEKTWLRWRRLDDPYDFTVRAIRRQSLPWWRKWQRLPETPPPAEPGPVRLVDLSDLALAGARRRRLTRGATVGGAVAAVLALAVARPSYLTCHSRHRPPTTVRPARNWPARL